MVGELVSPKTSHQVLKVVKFRMAVWSTGQAKTQPTTNLRPTLLNKNKVVVVTGIKKNSKSGPRPTLRKETACLQSRFFQKGSLTAVRENFRVKKFRRVFFRLNFLEKSGTSFRIFDFGGLPLSYHVSP